jgi:4-hydroxy-tetrahydrodipicolinate reductase
VEKIKVLVSGACGKMGQEVIKAVLKDGDLTLVSAVDIRNSGKDIGSLLGIESLGVPVRGDLGEALSLDKPQVMVDFTTPMTVMKNIQVALQAKIHVVVGTTGLSPGNIQEITGWCTSYGANVLVAPNFAIGALLMMRFAAEAAQYFPQVEIIELHHDQKLDAPSGTSIKTAEMILNGRGESAKESIGEEKIKGVRGGEMGGIHLHSIRLPGLIAHQEVIFGGQGQTLTIRHDSLSRESFMPGVVLAVKQISERRGLTYGLDELLF